MDLSTNLTTNAHWSAVSHTEYDAELIHVTSAATRRFPNIRISGQASSQLKEFLPQIRAAIEVSEFRLPKREILISLSQTRQPKSGAHLHFAIAVSLIRLSTSAIGGLTSSEMKSKSVLLSAELDLTGKLKGVGYAHRTLSSAIQHGYHEIWISTEDLSRYQKAISSYSDSALEAHPIIIRTFEHLNALRLSEGRHAFPILSLKNKSSASFFNVESYNFQLPKLTLSQYRLLLASKIGNLPTLLLGSQGTGKTSLLDWFKTPPYGVNEVSLPSIAFLQELDHPMETDFKRPFVSLSPFSKFNDLLGTYRQGILKTPGILARAHGGVLTADEICEAPREIREYLRETLSHKRFTTRTQGASVESHFHFIATANSCRCGGWPLNWFETLEEATELESQIQICRCTKHSLRLYSQRLLGPFFDRMECIILFPPINQKTHEGLKVNANQIMLSRGIYQQETWEPLAPRKWRRIFDRISLRGRGQWSRLAHALYALDASQGSASSIDTYWKEAYSLQIQRKTLIKRHYQSDSKPA